MKANAPSHEAFVTENKLPGRSAVLLASSAGQVRTSGRPVEGHVDVQKLAEIHVRLRVRPLRHVSEVQPHEAVHQAGGQMPQVSLCPGAGIQQASHLLSPLGLSDGRRRGGRPPTRRRAKLGHDAGHSRGEPVLNLHRQPPRRCRP